MMADTANTGVDDVMRFRSQPSTPAVDIREFTTVHPLDSTKRVRVMMIMTAIPITENGKAGEIAAARVLRGEIGAIMDRLLTHGGPGEETQG